MWIKIFYTHENATLEFSDKKVIYTLEIINIHIIVEIVKVKLVNVFKLSFKLN